MSANGAKKKEKYERLKREAKSFYFQVRHVYSPALKSEVHFTRSGFNHLIEGAEGEREKAEQIRRFKLLPLAVKLIADPSSHAKHYHRLWTPKTKSRQGQQKRAVPLSFWSIGGLLEGRRIKVVVRKVGHDGQMQFLSVYRDQAAKARRNKGFRRLQEGEDDWE